MTSPADSAPRTTAGVRSANVLRVLDALRRRSRTSAAAQQRLTDLTGGATSSPPATTDPLTQADLARITGLAPATISSIVRTLVSEGLVDTSPGSGRRGKTVWLAPGSGLVAGIDVGHTHLTVALGDLNGALLSQRRTSLRPDDGYQHVLREADRLLAELLVAAGRPHSDLRSVGLGLPVPIADGVIRSSAIMPGWVGVRPRELAEEHFGCPAYVENDANLGALAEHRIGVAQGFSNVVVIKISSGIGAGIIMDDRLLRGTAGTAGEVGHLTLQEQGPVCRCGSRGCLEAYVSTATVQSMLADQLPGATFDQIVAAARADHTAARRTLEDTGLHLGWGIASLVNLLNPDLVVVGGDMAAAGELLLEPARVALRRHALDIAAGTSLQASQLGELALVLGAILLAAESTELLG